MTPAGRLLRELAMVERTQAASLFTELGSTGDAAVIRFPGGEVTLQLDGTRGQIVQSLRKRGATVRAPFEGEPDTIPGDPGRHEVWCELLDDLGSSSRHLCHLDPRLTGLEVSRGETTAWILVGNGLRTMVYEVKLDGGEMTAAAAVDIAGAFGEGG
ncbi:hypothetical protein [Paeniglutamicibacter cryotolerans]|nr:hypothetical protein [Paeniglutamicibacter cryotolerans]